MLSLIISAINRLWRFFIINTNERNLAQVLYYKVDVNCKMCQKVKEKFVETPHSL